MVCFVDVGLSNAIRPLTELFKFRVGFNRASGFGSVGSGPRPHERVKRVNMRRRDRIPRERGKKRLSRLSDIKQTE